MRLLHFDEHGELTFTKDFENNFPPYAILSHTWGADEDEVTFNDIKLAQGKGKAGYEKIRLCGTQAAKDGLAYFWVDTCSINKADFTEVSEAINSMYRWYGKAAKCYVYLSDVVFPPDDVGENQYPWLSAFQNTRWFTRGWTLQELIAPASVDFFSQEWTHLGNKESLKREIHKITGIPEAALEGAAPSCFTIYERMRWAQERQTKKEEDKAYSLLGIFGLFMPLIYGEGGNAFIRLREEIHRSQRSRLDLEKVPVASGASFNSNDVDHTTCHPDTRVNLLSRIRHWAQQPQHESILWLSGMAGTGKSTISLTIATWLAGQGSTGIVDLAGSFFFKRGEGDRGHALRFFSTIARDLALKVPGLDNLVAEAITSDPFIFTKSLRDQFNTLLYQPLKRIGATPAKGTIFIIVVDALDECDSERDVRTILDLWSRLSQLNTICLRLFLTSRPDLPIRTCFKSMAVAIYHEIVLQEAVPAKEIREDLTIYLEDAFSQIRRDYNTDSPAEIHLAEEWPGSSTIKALVKMVFPLFIAAATVCRFVGDQNWDPQEQLDRVLASKGPARLELMEHMYLPLVRHLPATLSDSRDKDKLYQEFRTVIGSIVSLAEPLSATALSEILNIPLPAITRRLRQLHSVLQVPDDPDAPIRTLHVSFADFLLSDRWRYEPFGLDPSAMHQILLTKCLKFLSGPSGLRENIFNLSNPGHERLVVDRASIKSRLSPALQYACRYWTHHAQHGKIQARDDDEVHVFLREHLLHWIEALTFMSRVRDVSGFLSVLQTTVATHDSCLFELLEDARQIIRRSIEIVDCIPLQIYYSAMVFAPQSSKVRSICGQIPSWLKNFPDIPLALGVEVEQAEGHSSAINSAVFSHDGALFASASQDTSVQLWNPKTGKELQKLDGHIGSVKEVRFSHDGTLLASASSDTTVRIWNAEDGRHMHTLVGHTDCLTALAFSHDDSVLASAAGDFSIRLWNPRTGERLFLLLEHKFAVNTIAFSYDDTLLASASRDETIWLWNTRTGRPVRLLDGHEDSVNAVAFSHDRSRVASGSWDTRVYIWDTSTGDITYIFTEHVRSVNAVGFSQNSALVASADDQVVFIWEPLIGQVLQRFEGIPWIDTIEFTAHDKAILTNRGIMSLLNPLEDGQTSEPPMDSTTVMEFAWLRRGADRLLWLPPKYRSGYTAYHNGVFAIGMRSGGVIFLPIQPPPVSTPPASESILQSRSAYSQELLRFSQHIGSLIGQNRVKS